MMKGFRYYDETLFLNIIVFKKRMMNWKGFPILEDAIKNS